MKMSPRAAALVVKDLVEQSRDLGYDFDAILDLLDGDVAILQLGDLDSGEVSAFTMHLERVAP